MDDEKLKNAIQRFVADLGISEAKAKNLIEDAVIMVLDYTSRDVMVDAMWLYARQLAIIAFNRESTEGESSRSEGGISQSFIEDIPLNIKHSLNRYRVGKVVSYYAPKKT